MGGTKHATRQRMKSPYVSRDNNHAFVLQFTKSKAVATSGAKNAMLKGTLLYKVSNGDVQEESFEAKWGVEHQHYHVKSTSISAVIANQEKIEVTYNGKDYTLYNEHTYADLRLVKEEEEEEVEEEEEEEVEEEAEAEESVNGTEILDLHDLATRDFPSVFNEDTVWLVDQSATSSDNNGSTLHIANKYGLEKLILSNDYMQGTSNGSDKDFRMLHWISKPDPFLYDVDSSYPTDMVIGCWVGSGVITLFDKDGNVLDNYSYGTDKADGKTKYHAAYFIELDANNRALGHVASVVVANMSNSSLMIVGIKETASGYAFDQDDANVVLFNVSDYILAQSAVADLFVEGIKPITARPIVPADTYNIDRKTYAGVALSSGGFLIVEYTSTEIKGTKLYTPNQMPSAGLLSYSLLYNGTYSIYANHGVGTGTTTSDSKSSVYRIDYRYDADLDTGVFDDPVTIFTKDTGDSHGMVPASDEVLVAVDRDNNILTTIPFNGDPVDHVSMYPVASRDIAMDLIDAGLPVSGSVPYTNLYASNRGDNPLTGNNSKIHNAQGTAAGISIIKSTDEGKTLNLTYILNVYNIVTDDDGEKTDIGDAHGILVLDVRDEEEEVEEEAEAEESVNGTEILDLHDLATRDFPSVFNEDTVWLVDQSATSSDNNGSTLHIANKYGLEKLILSNDYMQGTSNGSDKDFRMLHWISKPDPFLYDVDSSYPTDMVIGCWVGSGVITLFDKDGNVLDNYSYGTDKADGKTKYHAAYFIELDANNRALGHVASVVVANMSNSSLMIVGIKETASGYAFDQDDANVVLFNVSDYILAQSAVADLFVEGIKPITARPIVPADTYNIDRKTYAGVALSSGGFLIVEYTSTEIKGTKLYTPNQMPSAGLLSYSLLYNGTYSIYANHGVGTGTTTSDSKSSVYRIDYRYDADLDTGVFDDPVTIFTKDTGDSHGMVPASDEVLVAVDRDNNILTTIPFNGDPVDHVSMYPVASRDIAMDLIDAGLPVSGSVPYTNLYASNRGDNPLTGNNSKIHNAQGTAAGISIIKSTDEGKTLNLTYILNVYNIVTDDDGEKTDIGDAHGILVL